MQDLIKSYRATIKDTEHMLEVKLREAEAQKKEKNIEENNVGKYSVISECPFVEDITILRSMLSSMRLALSMLNKDMRIKKNLGKLSKENREIAFDPQWISRREDARADVYEPDETTKENQLEVQNQKARLVKSMTSSLTQRQKEILEMVSNGYTHQEIADVLDVQPSTVSNTIAQAKEKIKKEGWFML